MNHFFLLWHLTVSYLVLGLRVVPVCNYTTSALTYTAGCYFMTHGLLTVSKKEITLPLLIIVTKQYPEQQVRFLNRNYIFVIIFSVFEEICKLFINSKGKTFPTAFTKLFPLVGNFPPVKNHRLSLCYTVWELPVKDCVITYSIATSSGHIEVSKS